MLHEVINWLITTIGAMGYTAFFTNGVESSIVPIPSEIIMPPAGYLVQQGQLNMALVILSGTLGSLFGAYLNYFAAHYLGRPFYSSTDVMVLITEEHFRRVEDYFASHGEISTFIGRMLPVIRHLISLARGISRYEPHQFSVYTLLGSFIWSPF